MVMTFKKHILASKQSIPIHPELFIPPRLSGLMAGMAEKRLTLVTAGAGLLFRHMEVEIENDI